MADSLWQSRKARNAGLRLVSFVCRELEPCWFCCARRAHRASIFSLESGLDGLPLRATFSPVHPLANIFHPAYPPIASKSISRDVPLARARALNSLNLYQGEAKVALYCAHRTSTVSSCAFCEQEGHLAAPRPSKFVWFSFREFTPALKGNTGICDGKTGTRLIDLIWFVEFLAPQSG
jgi:hypothetical protein